jgi:excisionase family DNA binding protein
MHHEASTPPNPNDLITVAPAARILKMSEGFVRRAADDGRLHSTRTSTGLRVFRRCDLDRFLDERRR